MPIMGREWYYWGGGGGNGRRSSKRGGLVAETDHISSGGGCMCAVFQAFDFHPFHFSINHRQQQPPSHKSHSSISQDLHTSSVPKGAEAPRNSLESEDGTASYISKEEDLKIPKNIRIRTRGSTTKSRAGSLSDVSSEISISSSPGTKTPTLVARLMGLDLLPDANSSSSSSSSCLSTPNQQQGNNYNNNNPHLHHLKQRKQHIQILRHRNSTDNIGTVRSLPETPRMSLARRSDVEHRLSLQINKENMGRLGEDLDPPRFSFSKRKYDENNSSYCRSPSHYARQIVKQVKDSVSRRVGLDITNTVKNREQAREELVGQFRFKKLTKKSSSSVDNESSPGKNSNSSFSPRLSRFLEIKNKPSTKQSSSSPLTPKDQNTHQVVPKSPSPPPPPPLANIETTQLSSRVLTKPKPQQALPEKDLQSQKPVPIKGKKVTNEKFSSRLNKPPPQASIKNKQEESFVTRPPSPNRASDIKAKSKRTHPLSSNLVNSLNNVPNVLHAKKDPSPPATKIPQKQVCDGGQEPKRIAQFSSCSRQKYKQEARHSLATRETSNSSSASTTTINTEPNDEGAEFQYITTILTQTGLRRVMLPNLQYQWFSPSHPLDPSIFHNLENYPSPNSSISFPGSDKDCIFTQKDQQGLRCNRRLLFDLVNELLSEILVRPKCHKGLLLETVWKRVRSFPRAKCEVLEDIDGLIEMEDMKRKMKEEEEEGGGEGLVVEIGRSILETLVHETVTVMVGA